MCRKFYDCSTILGGGEKSIDRSIPGTQQSRVFVTASNLAVISHSGGHMGGFSFRCEPSEDVCFVSGKGFPICPFEDPKLDFAIYFLKQSWILVISATKIER